jgi:hypothetical protein
MSEERRRPRPVQEGTAVTSRLSYDRSTRIAERMLRHRDNARCRVGHMAMRSTAYYDAAGTGVALATGSVTQLLDWLDRYGTAA